MRGFLRDVSVQIAAAAVIGIVSVVGVWLATLTPAISAYAPFSYLIAFLLTLIAAALAAMMARHAWRGDAPNVAPLSTSNDAASLAEKIRGLGSRLAENEGAIKNSAIVRERSAQLANIAVAQHHLEVLGRIDPTDMCLSPADKDDNARSDAAVHAGAAAEEVLLQCGYDWDTITKRVEDAQEKIRSDAAYLLVSGDETGLWKSGNEKQHWHIGYARIRAVRALLEEAKQKEAATIQTSIGRLKEANQHELQQQS